MGSAVKGYLDPVVLAVLATGPLHGYAVIEELKARSGGELDLPEGTVHPALHPPEHGGVLKSSWSRAEGRRRRVYRLTASGRREIETRTRDWRGFRRGGGGVLARCA